MNRNYLMVKKVVVYLLIISFFFASGMVFMALVYSELGVAYFHELFEPVEEGPTQNNDIKNSSSEEVLKIEDDTLPPPKDEPEGRKILLHYIPIPTLQKDDYCSSRAISNEGVETQTIEKEIFNPYVLEGIDFSSSNTVKISFYDKDNKPIMSWDENGKEIPLVISFVPILASEPEGYDVDTGKAGVWADSYGNITINVHSGCSIAVHNKPLEGELLRRYLEGGTCSNIYQQFSASRTSENIDKIHKALIQQSNNTTEVIYEGSSVVPQQYIEIVDNMDPKRLIHIYDSEWAYNTTERWLTVVICGRDLNYEDYHIAKRWITTLKIDIKP